MSMYWTLSLKWSIELINICAKDICAVASAASLLSHSWVEPVISPTPLIYRNITVSISLNLTLCSSYNKQSTKKMYFIFNCTTFVTSSFFNWHFGLTMPASFYIVRAHFWNFWFVKVFFSRIWHAVVLTQFRYADSKSAPCQALFCVFPTQNSKTKLPPKFVKMSQLYITA